MTAQGPTLADTALPPLGEPIGPLTADPADELSIGDDAPFTVAGRRAWVTGGAGRGIDHVVATPVVLSLGPDVAGASAQRAVVTPLGIERYLMVDGVAVIERIAVPRDGRFAVLEWEATGRAVTLEARWLVPMAAEATGGAAGAARAWQRSERGVVVAMDGESRAAFVFSAVPSAFTVAADAAGGGVAVRASVRVPAGGSVRLALVRGADPAALERGLRAAGRSRALVQGRRGAVEQLRAERLALTTPDPDLDRALDWVGIRLAASVADTPGVGRSVIAGRQLGPGSYPTAPAVRAALDGLDIGDFDTARDVLSFLHHHLHGSGHVPGTCDLAGRTTEGDAATTLLTLLLVARFLDATGDLGFLQEKWPAIRRSWDAVRQSAASTDAALRAAAVDGLARAAEAVGDTATAADARVVFGRGARPDGSAGRAGWDGPASHDPTGAVARVRELLGVEPDASRGRLVLRPRPPLDWTRFEARSLAMGDARLTLAYRREGSLHRFTVRQDRGAAPLRLVLEPELRGRLRAARVDGEPAELTPVAVGNRTRVPVQLALDHERTLELEMEDIPGGKAETPGG